MTLAFKEWADLPIEDPTPYEMGIASRARVRNDPAMRVLVVIGLWIVSGSYLGGVIERVTGLGLTIPVLAAFAVAGIYLGFRILTGGASPSGRRAFRFAGVRRRPTP
jgi:hypothetical protein